jgi:hypothetical protein
VNVMASPDTRESFTSLPEVSVLGRAYVSYSNPSFDYGALHQRFRQCGDESD